MRARSRSKKGVAEPVIGPRIDLGYSRLACATRWLANAEAIQRHTEKPDCFVAMLLAMTMQDHANRHDHADREYQILSSEF